MFALYISHYLTFALHSVGQGPVSLYNNFICAKGFPQHFNGPSPVHTSCPSRTVTWGAACYGYKPVTGATTARCSASFAIKTPKTPNTPSNSFEQNKWRLRASHSQNHFPKHIIANERHLASYAAASAGSLVKISNLCCVTLSCNQRLFNLLLSLKNWKRGARLIAEPP